ncbi:MAG: hypothetical protein J6S67_02120 [Methanobrevibacter sp.]|nr:hypothetical protein [Methanobrevibacter sp.]
MKLKNKKTGEIGEPITIRHDGTVFVVTKIGMPYCKESILGKYRSLAELNEEWEDYEEPKEYWYIDDAGVIQIDLVLSSEINMRKSIGNYFETKEEAEKAVEKLKAWKLLKDECDIKFDGIIRDDKAKLKAVKLSYDRHTVTITRMRECMDALHLLFGGEE